MRVCVHVCVCVHYINRSGPNLTKIHRSGPCSARKKITLIMYVYTIRYWAVWTLKLSSMNPQYSWRVLCFLPSQASLTNSLEAAHLSQQVPTSKDFAVCTIHTHPTPRNQPTYWWRARPSASARLSLSFLAMASLLSSRLRHASSSRWKVNVQTGTRNALNCLPLKESS